VAPVKSRSNLSLRAERAGVTKSRIAESARRLFSARGYGATTLAEVADEAGVAVQTIYAVFGSKAGILRVLREGLLHQPEAARLYEAAITEPNSARKLELFAASIRHRWETGQDIVSIHEQAAASDPELRKEVDAVLGTRRDGIRRLAHALEPALAPGIPRAAAAAILDALTLAEVYRELVQIHAWSSDDFEAWLAAVLKNQLLP